MLIIALAKLVFCKYSQSTLMARNRCSWEASISPFSMGE